MATNFTTKIVSFIQDTNDEIHKIKSVPFHATMSDWEQDFDTADYIPEQGEIIIYDTDVTHDYARIKIGDGVSTILNLPFWHESLGFANDSDLTAHTVNEKIHIAQGTGEYAEVFNDRADNVASGKYSHAEGGGTKALGPYTHAEGLSTEAAGAYTHAEGWASATASFASHAEGFATKATNAACHAEGSTTEASGEASHAEGNKTTASGNYSHVEGYASFAEGVGAHAEGGNITDTGDISENTRTTSGLQQEISGSTAYGHVSHVEGCLTYAEGYASHAEGNRTDALGVASHAEGYHTTASKHYSHAEGELSVASGYASHAEGSSTASGDYSHSEGEETTASDSCSHAEGSHTTASNYCSHAEGEGTTASGDCSHAEGLGTEASGDSQHVQGKYNISDANLAHIVGNGSKQQNRSNAHTLDWDGNAWYAGDIYVGSTSGTNKDAGSKKVATVDDVSTLKNDLLNGAGAAYDTLKELGDLIDDNQDAIEALETIATTKANASDLTAHAGDTTAHVTAAQTGNWNTAYTIAQSMANNVYTKAQTDAAIQAAIGAAIAASY